MKILTVSDKVEDLLYSEQIVPRFRGADLIISCGDLPAYYLEYMVTMLNVPLYFVFGNHVDETEPAESGKQAGRPGGGINLDDRVVNHKGLLIAGLEGSMRYNRGHFQYTEAGMRAKIARLVPRLLWNRLRWGRYLDILVTHAPPCGIHDAEDVCHMGFKGYLWLMDRFCPRYLLHGHTHVCMPHQPTRTIYGRTEVINAYGYRVLDIEVPPRPLEAAAAEAVELSSRPGQLGRGAN